MAENVNINNIEDIKEATFVDIEHKLYFRAFDFRKFQNFAALDYYLFIFDS